MQAADAPAVEFPPHSTEPELPFHPEQSLQEAQHAADEKLMHDARASAGSAQDLHAEAPDEVMAEATHAPEHGSTHAQIGEPSDEHPSPAKGDATEMQQRPPQQMRLPQSVPAVRTLDDIMSQFEGVAQPLQQAFSPPAARQERQTLVGESPRQEHAPQADAAGHRGHSGHSRQMQGADAGQDLDMVDAAEAGTPQQAAAEMSNETPLQGKV